jgi:hypothetical protein
MVKTIDNVSANIAYKLGFNHVPWFTLTKVVLGIYAALTCMVLFFRPDFVNLTICTLGYDLAWFLITDYSSDPSDGGVQKSVKNFSLTVSYFSFFFRVIYKALTNLFFIDYRSPCILEGLPRLQ